MNSLKNVILVLAALLISSFPAVASTSSTEVWVRAYHTRCSSYDSTLADFDVTFHDSTLPWGTKVKLVSGLAGNEVSSQGFRDFHWDSSVEQEMHALSAHTWQARRSVTLANRSNPKHYSALEYVLKIEEPGKDSYYSTISNGDYWRTATVTNNLHCASGGVLPAFQKVEVQAAK